MPTKKEAVVEVQSRRRKKPGFFESLRLDQIFGRKFGRPWFAS